MFYSDNYPKSQIEFIERAGEAMRKIAKIEGYKIISYTVSFDKIEICYLDDYQRAIVFRSLVALEEYAQAITVKQIAKDQVSKANSTNS